VHRSWYLAGMSKRPDAARADLSVPERILLFSGAAVTVLVVRGQGSDRAGRGRAARADESEARRARCDARFKLAISFIWRQKRSSPMSMRGQWVTTYDGSNSGELVAEIDEVGNHYEGTICAWDSKPTYPNSLVSITTETMAPSQKLHVLIMPIDNIGDPLSPATVEKG
jgi:hypothetical protein